MPVLLIPTNIVFKPNLIQAGKAERLQSWMNQWSIPNNFQNILVRGPYELTQPLLDWVNEFICSCKSATGYDLESMGILADFTFEYNEIEIEFGVPFWLANRNNSKSINLEVAKALKQMQKVEHAIS